MRARPAEPVDRGGRSGAGPAHELTRDRRKIVDAARNKKACGHRSARRLGAHVDGGTTSSSAPAARNASFGAIGDGIAERLRDEGVRPIGRGAAPMRTGRCRLRAVIVHIFAPPERDTTSSSATGPRPGRCCESVAGGASRESRRPRICVSLPDSVDLPDRRRPEPSPRLWRISTTAPYAAERRPRARPRLSTSSTFGGSTSVQALQHLRRDLPEGQPHPDPDADHRGHRLHRCGLCERYCPDLAIEVLPKRDETAGCLRRSRLRRLRPPVSRPSPHIPTLPEVGRRRHRPTSAA